jgi:hypothetical protein
MMIRRLVGRVLSPAQKRQLKMLLAERLNLRGPTGYEGACELPYKVLVGTHHKTGTVWLRTIFWRICKQHSLKLFAGEPGQATGLDYDIFFQQHSRFDLQAFDSPVRGVHLIRDPRDVVISGCFYHQRSAEAWLHVPRTHLGGETYQQAILRRATVEDRILFEMEHTGRETIEEMIGWNYSMPSFYELKYEDIINDADLMQFHRVFSFLGFPGRLIPGLLSIAQGASLSSQPRNTSDHIRSGLAAQWKQYFTPRLKSRFIELFGTALIHLGYERDHDWRADAS